MAVFFFFDDNRANVALFFAVSTLVLALGPEFFVPSMSPTRGVPVVEAPCGHVRGTRLHSRDLNRDIYAYYGIPFAKPPVGTRRFARPEPPSSPWPGVHDGTAPAPVCAQPIKVGEWYSSYFGQEDCLTLNVYVPKHSLGKKKLPVMFWIHGGGFTSGEATDKMYGPKYLLDRDVILVTAQYRLGPLGFMDLDHPEIGGNQALWDQRMAMQWVQDNIAAFGGDPKRVTIFGESAGSFSVMYHLASEGSRGLFSAAIAQSGSLDGPFHNLDRARPMSELHSEFALAVGCDPAASDRRKTADCLRDKPLDDIFGHLLMFDQCNLLAGMNMAFPGAWKPVHDGAAGRRSSAADGGAPFFGPGRSPRQILLRDGARMLDVPLMTGSTAAEGILRAAAVRADQEKNSKMLRNDWEKCLLTNAFGKRFEEGGDLSAVDKILAEKIAKRYFDGKKGSQFDPEGDWDSLVSLFTDSGWTYQADDAVSSLLKSEGRRSPVFQYRFSHRSSSFSLGDVFSETFPLGVLSLMARKAVGLHATADLGTCHGDDLLYLFGSDRMPVGFLGGEDDLDMSRVMVDLWANFATHHDPTPKGKDGNLIGENLRGLDRWPASVLDGTGHSTFAEIRDSKLFPKQKPDVETLDFWRDAFEEVKFDQ